MESISVSKSVMVVVVPCGSACPLLIGSGLREPLLQVKWIVAAIFPAGRFWNESHGAKKNPPAV
jgi:hypothetical protein